MTGAHTDTIAGVLAGDRRAVARAISCVEDTPRAAAAIVGGVYRQSGRALLVGVTGSPGVGKSSLVDRMIALWRGRGQTVGVLAVDPSSPFSGGAVLGDRVRMQTHAGDAGVFVRSMATRGQLGGLARATGDAAVILDAAGYGIVVIETVGVGQAEVEVAQAADLTIVVTMPGTGDGVQALKAGVMEIADLFVVNKADLAGASRAVAEIETVIGLREPSTDAWRPPVLETRASRGDGVEAVLDGIDRFLDHQGSRAEARRRQRVVSRLRQLLADRVLEEAAETVDFDAVAAQVARGEVDPYSAVDRLLTEVLERVRRRPSADANGDGGGAGQGEQ